MIIRLIGDLILRTILILIGLFAAMFAAGLFFSYGFNREALQLNGIDGQVATMGFTAGALISSVLVGAAAHIPAIFAITLAEFMRLRGLVINLCLGGLVAVIAAYRQFGVDAVVRGDGQVPDPQGSTGALLVVLAAGFIGGFVYWLIAGRGAGKWLDQSRLRRKKISDAATTANQHNSNGDNHDQANP